MEIDKDAFLVVLLHGFKTYLKFKNSGNTK